MVSAHLIIAKIADDLTEVFFFFVGDPEHLGHNILQTL
jgi:hypothetical protein